MSSLLRLLLLCSAVLVVANEMNASANLTAAGTEAQSQQTGTTNGVESSMKSWQMWSLDPQALAAAGCSDDAARKVKACEAYEQAHFYRHHHTTDEEEWCLDLFVTVSCWPPCFCNAVSGNQSSSYNNSVNHTNHLLGPAWVKKHLEDMGRPCTLMPACKVSLSTAAETETEKEATPRPVLAAAARACPVVHVWVLLVLFVVSAFYESIKT